MTTSQSARLQPHYYKSIFHLTFALTLFVFVSTSSQLKADVRLPGFYGNHMVLQQQSKIRIWGWADADETVTVSIGDNVAKATTNSAGKWQVELKPMKASKNPVTLSVKGNNQIEIKDVLVGEVWLCSGQSNMEWSVKASGNANEEIAAANHPLIRHIKIPRQPSPIALNDVESNWEICSPDTAATFTACGYYMARKLQAELDVPIGLVNSSWGGTRVEPWTPPVGFKKVDAVKDIYQSVVGRTPGNPAYQKQLSDYIKSTEQWLDKAKNSVDSNQLLKAPPAYPATLVPFKSHQDPTMLYNGMIHGLVGFPIRGAIWYQGESNHADGMLYFEKKKALIQGWRELWGQGDFPFYFVQIAPFKYGTEDPTILAKFWEAQAKCTTLPNVGMVVINDIATLNNIHPPNKQEVGLRLANMALKNDYGKTDVVAYSPEFDSIELLGSSLKVKFNRNGGGLKTRDGKTPSHFEVIDKNSNGFQPATATIVGDSIVMLKSEAVTAPTAFRYAWDKLAEPNLCGGTGLPVGAVRGGKVPSFSDSLPLADYELVYELDLAKLKGKIDYDVDNSDKIKSFDRIGYFVELNSSEFGKQSVFVTMNAFTDDVKKIGIPTVGSKAHFQQKVQGLEIFSSTSKVKSGKLDVGNIEFWPNNYAPQKENGVPGSSTLYDFNDTPGDPIFGYGSMQVHNFQAKQTVFAINHWKAESNADVGIGNRATQHPDWTFSGSSKNYTSKKLRVFVRSK